MTPRPGDVAGKEGWKGLAKGEPTLGAALSLLLIVVSLAPMAGAAAGELPWRSVAAADHDGGSTVPIPPPKQSTPQDTTPQGPTQTPPEAPTPTGTHVSLDLAQILAGGGMSAEADGSGAQWVIFPPSLDPGESATTFEDPDAGIAWRTMGPEREGVLTIILTRGGFHGTLSVSLGPLQGNGQEARATVLEVTLEAGPMEVAGVGAQGGAVRLSAELHRLPLGIELDLQGVAPDAGLVSALGEAAGVLNMGVAALAYAARIDADLANSVASASVHMAVDQAWAAAWPRDRIHVVRIGAEGTGSILETTPAGEDALGQAWFSAQSPAGFSTFALVALGQLTTGESESGLSWALWLGASLGVIALLGLATGAFLLAASVRWGRGP